MAYSTREVNSNTAWTAILESHEKRCIPSFKVRPRLDENGYILVVCQHCKHILFKWKSSRWFD